MVPTPRLRVRSVAIACVASLWSCVSTSGNEGGLSAGAEVGIATTRFGDVVGTVDPAVIAWKGIPYAAAPVGDLRWRAPAPPAKWTTPRIAQSFGPSCPQPRMDSNRTLFDHQSEDCLTLNVWAPRDRCTPGLIPVMVWIHGGGFVSGGSAIDEYDGSRIAARGMIVVSLNYRLGPLGFLAHPAFGHDGSTNEPVANFGLLDQIAALTWIRDNITSFGGDPHQVGVVGQSSGGVSVCALMASPAASGLFQRAVSQSGPCLSERDVRHLDARNEFLDSGIEQTLRLATASGCATATDAEAMASCMRSLPPSELKTEFRPGYGVVHYPDEELYGPIVDGVVLPVAPATAVNQGASQSVPLLAGSNADEGTVFVKPSRVRTDAEYRAMLSWHFNREQVDAILAAYPSSSYDAKPYLAARAVVRDAGFTCLIERTLRERALRSTPTDYTYSFTSSVFGSRLLGVYHGAEVPFLFGTFSTQSSTGAALSADMQDYWTSFVADGHPVASHGPTWPPFDVGAPQYLEIGDERIVRAGHVTSGQERCAFWRDLLGATL